MADQDHALVVGPNGMRGMVLGPSLSSPNEIAIELDDGTQLSVPPSALTLQPGGKWCLTTEALPTGEPIPLATAPPIHQAAAEPNLQNMQIREEPVPNAEDSEMVIPVISEDLEVSKRKRVTGGVRVERKSVPHYQAVSMPLTRQVADVKRVLIEKPVNGPLPVRREGDTIIMPVVEEVATVHKQLMLKEEIHITKRTSTEQHEEQVQLNTQQAEIVRTDSSGRQVSSADMPLPAAAQPEILPPEERSILDPTQPRPSFLNPRRRPAEVKRKSMLEGD
ncbi:MAG: YsnF/AvaK domain-containing protein [Bryobacteraceae bacterium]